MIKIVKTSEKVKSIKKFNQIQWRDYEKSRYGTFVPSDDKNFCFKAMVNGKIAGVVSGECGDGVVYVESLIVDRELRGLGTGKKLMKKVEKYALENKSHKIYLNTGKKWESTKFYKKIGYEREGILKMHTLGEDHVIFSKFI